MGAVFILCMIQVVANVIIRYFVKAVGLRKRLLLSLLLLLLLVSILPIIKLANILLESGVPDAVSFSGSQSILILPIIIIVVQFSFYIWERYNKKIRKPVN